MSPRKVIGRDGDRVLVDLDTVQPGTAQPVALGAVVLDNGEVTPALPLLAYDAAGLYDQPVDDPDAVLAKVPPVVNMDEDPADRNWLRSICRRRHPGQR